MQVQVLSPLPSPEKSRAFGALNFPGAEYLASVDVRERAPAKPAPALPTDARNHCAATLYGAFAEEGLARTYLLPGLSSCAAEGFSLFELLGFDPKVLGLLG